MRGHWDGSGKLIPSLDNCDKEQFFQLLRRTATLYSVDRDRQALQREQRFVDFNARDNVLQSLTCKPSSRLL